MEKKQILAEVKVNFLFQILSIPFGIFILFVINDSDFPLGFRAIFLAVLLLVYRWNKRKLVVFEDGIKLFGMFGKRVVSFKEFIKVEKELHKNIIFFGAKIILTLNSGYELEFPYDKAILDERQMDFAIKKIEELMKPQENIEEN